jgi:(p)ppGpp synthase/HD superfamily hydrolase
MSHERKNVVRKAEEFATKAHAGQTLKIPSREPFIEHPRRVVALVGTSGGSEDEMAAAWLHDIVEDTPVTLADIAREFGDIITELVDGLTDPPHFEGNPNRIRKRWQAERVRGKSAGVKRVKIADQTVNVALMTVTPPVGWTDDMRWEYIEGAKLIADECARVSDFLDRAFADAYGAATRVFGKN